MADPLDLRSAVDVFTRLTDLQARAARDGTPHVDVHGLAAMRQAAEDERAALAAGDVDGAIDADDRFHGVLVTAAGDPAAQAEVGALLAQVRRFDRVFFAGKSFATPTTDDHDAILDAVAAGDAERAAALVHASFAAAVARLRERLDR